MFPTAGFPDADTREIRRDLRGKHVCIKIRHVCILRLDSGRPKGNVSVYFRRFSCGGKSIVPPFLFHRVGRNHGESVFERKCTRVKTPALPLYSPTRICGPSPARYYVHHNISVGKSSSLAIIRQMRLG